MFGKKEIMLMFSEGLEWLGKQQVKDKNNRRHGCIYYPTENRYCNRDTGCAAALFMRQYHLTGDIKWKKKASSARDYLLDVQLDNGGYQELRGLENSDNGSAVNTSIIADNLIKAFSLGLNYSSRDLKALENMADFELTLEWKPGAFYHDTNHLGAFDDARGCQWGKDGSKRDCQNSTALSSMMLQKIFYFLQKEGYPVKREWLKAATRGINHLLEKQMKNGHWAYCVDSNWYDVGHHGMTMFHLEQASEFLPFKENQRVKKSLIRGGKWLVKEGLLHTEKGSKINWAIERSACIYFTWGYFMVSAPLARLANIDSRNGKFWRKEAIELLRYVRMDLWDNPFKEKEGPFRLTEGNVAIGYSFFGQSLGWCLYMLDDLIEHMGWF